MNLQEEIFILLDNGSDNNDMEIYSNKYKNTKKGWRLVRVEKNLGFGGGIIHCSKLVDKNFVGWMPGNMKQNPKDVFNLFYNLENHEKDVLIKAKRISRPLSDSLKTKLFGLIITIFFRSYLYDIGGTPNLVNKQFFNISDLIPNDYRFDIFVYYYCKRKKYKIIRPKVAYTTRLYGKSHWQNGILPEIKLTLDTLNSKKSWDEIIKKNYTTGL
tara:strand:- start:34 stop:675 length:642 start_codon:yes stop_codon:yes gene_type:complete